MSAYSEVSTQFNDGELLIEALTEMGFTPQNHIGKPQPLTGYQGDKRTDVADIIIPRTQVGGSSNDLGFIRGEDGKFKAIISDYDSTKYNEKWLKTLRTNYADKGIMRQAKRAGLRFVSKKPVKGQMHYEFLKA